MCPCVCVCVCPSVCVCLTVCPCVQVTGLDGNYRITCHTVMQVLREHRDSVMAVLEAFVYDPLLNWRLMDSKPRTTARTTVGSADASPGC